MTKAPNITKGTEYMNPFCIALKYLWELILRQTDKYDVFMFVIFYVVYPLDR